MARVARRAASAFAPRTANRAARRRRHKVVMETVTQEKKKLRSVLSFEAKAPPGYTFIPAGNPQLTTACKEMCRNDGLKVFAVTTTPHMHTHNLSQHVHRIGYHFPSAVVATVCMDLGVYLTSTGKAVVSSQAIEPNKGRKRANSEVSQTTINTEARDVLLDLFPNIPEKDLTQIIKTSFQKGQRKVGTAVELPLARRAQLAVVAHIRHIYTDYDKLLKTTSFHEARSAVEESTLAKLVEWRGDDENGRTVLEDVFREVIVISDDEDSDIDEETVPVSADRDYSVEVIQRNARADELQTRPVNYAIQSHPETLRDLSDDDAHPGFRFIRNPPRNPKIDRRGFSRYQAWDRAINRYRNVIKQTNTSSAGDNPMSSYTAQQPPRHEPGPQAPCTGHIPVAPVSGSHQEHWISRPGDSVVRPVIESPLRALNLNHPVKLPLQNSPDFIDLTDGTVAERSSTFRKRYSTQPDGFRNAPVFVSGPNKDIGYGRSQDEHHIGNPIPYLTRPLVAQDHALPSIETPYPPLSGTRCLDSDRMDALTVRMNRGLAIRSMTPARPPIDSISHPVRVGPEPDIMGQSPKRRRLAQYEPMPTNHRSAAGLNYENRVPASMYKEAPTGKTYQSGYPPPRQTLLPVNLTSRRYDVPFERAHLDSHLSERPPGSSLLCGPSNLDSYSSLDTRKRVRDFDENRPLYRHNSELHEPQPHRFSPLQSHIVSSVDHPIAADNRLARTHLPSHTSDVRGRHGLYEKRSYGVDVLGPDNPGVRHVAAAESQARGHIIVSHDVSRSRSIYADDFIRPVNSLEPLPVEYTTQRPRVQASRGDGADPTLYQVSENRIMPPHSNFGSSYVDYRALRPTHGYVLDDLSMSHQDNTFLHNTQHEIMLRSEGSRENPDWVIAHRYSPYVTGSRENLQRPHPVADGKSIVIVD